MIENTKPNTNGAVLGSAAARLFAALAGGVFSAAFAFAEAPAGGTRVTAAGHPAEGRLESFLGQPKLDIQQLYHEGRYPNILVAVDGTVLALWGSDKVRLRRSEDGGQTWDPEILIGKGFHSGGAIVNEATGEILAFIEERHPPAPLTVYRSTDHGKTWPVRDVVIHPGANGNVPSMHMTEAGITLRHGTHAGRIIRAARDYAGSNDREKWPKHRAVAIYSDDGGKTWHTSDPFPALGIGEGAVAELSDGRIYFNSRRHWAPEGVNPLRRWVAWSEDDGETWKDLSICDVLPDGPQNTTYGCMGGLVRLPIKDKDILIYSNCDSAGPRRDHGTLWASFDGGKTWPLKRLIYEGDFGYSSLSAGRPATKSEGWIYAFFESRGEKVARFNLSWLLEGKKTNDGQLPNWLSQ